MSSDETTQQCIRLIRQFSVNGLSMQVPDDDSLDGTGRACFSSILASISLASNVLSSFIPPSDHCRPSSPKSDFLDSSRQGPLMEATDCRRSDRLHRRNSSISPEIRSSINLRAVRSPLDSAALICDLASSQDSATWRTRRIRRSRFRSLDSRSYSLIPSASSSQRSDKTE